MASRAAALRFNICILIVINVDDDSDIFSY